MSKKIKKVVPEYTSAIASKILHRAGILNTACAYRPITIFQSEFTKPCLYRISNSYDFKPTIIGNVIPVNNTKPLTLGLCCFPYNTDTVFIDLDDYQDIGTISKYITLSDIESITIVLSSYDSYHLHIKFSNTKGPCLLYKNLASVTPHSHIHAKMSLECGMSIIRMSKKNDPLRPITPLLENELIDFKTPKVICHVTQKDGKWTKYSGSQLIVPSTILASSSKSQQLMEQEYLIGNSFLRM